MIERLNRTYKASYRPTNGFDGANYDLALWVAYYNFLRPHKHTKYKPLNEVEMLRNADNMLGKWQLLIFLGQQAILNMQKNGIAASERGYCTLSHASCGGRVRAAPAYGSRDWSLVGFGAKPQGLNCQYPHFSRFI